MPFALALLPFAQAGGGGAGLGQDEVIVTVLLVGVGIFVVAGFALKMLFLTTLKRVLDQCAPHNRRMEPGQVYLNLIPCFGAVWMFFTVSRVGQTLRDEFDERGIDVPGDYGQQLGISYASLILAWIIPYVGWLFGIAGVICWIMYWVKMAEYNRHLSEGASYREERDDYRRRRRDEQREDDRRRDRDRDRRDRDDEDEDDDRPSRRSRYDD